MLWETHLSNSDFPTHHFDSGRFPGRVSRRKIKSTKVGKNHRISADECREFMQDKFALEVFKV